MVPRRHGGGGGSRIGITMFHVKHLQGKPLGGHRLGIRSSGRAAAVWSWFVTRTIRIGSNAARSNPNVWDEGRRQSEHP